jgi:hypothetical protein
MLVMSPVQTITDLLSTIPATLDCCGSGTQAVSMTTLNGLRDAAKNATDEEECVCRLLARCRSIVREHVMRCQVQADVDASLSGKPHARSEEALQSARELLHAIEARLGVDLD